MPGERAGEIANQQCLARSRWPVEQHAFLCGHAQAGELFAARREPQCISFDELEEPGRKHDFAAIDRFAPHQTQGYRPFIEGVLFLRGREYLASVRLGALRRRTHACEHGLRRFLPVCERCNLDPHAGSTHRIADIEQQDESAFLAREEP